LKDLNITNPAPKPPLKGLSRSSKLFKTIIAAIQEKKGEAIVSLDLKKIEESVTDFFIICQAGNHIQLGAIVDNIEQKVKEICNEKPYKREGLRGQSWLLIDYVDIVVHCFSPEQREFYQIEELWSDADRKEHNE
jgi:ribosome-associated protein